MLVVFILLHLLVFINCGKKKKETVPESLLSTVPEYLLDEPPPADDPHPPAPEVPAPTAPAPAQYADPRKMMSIKLSKEMLTYSQPIAQALFWTMANMIFDHFNNQKTEKLPPLFQLPKSSEKTIQEAIKENRNAIQLLCTEAHGCVAYYNCKTKEITIFDSNYGRHTLLMEDGVTPNSYANDIIKLFGHLYENQQIIVRIDRRWTRQGALPICGQMSFTALILLMDEKTKPHEYYMYKKQLWFLLKKFANGKQKNIKLEDVKQLIAVPKDDAEKKRGVARGLVTFIITKERKVFYTSLSAPEGEKKDSKKKQVEEKKEKEKKDGEEEKKEGPKKEAEPKENEQKKDEAKKDEKEDDKKSEKKDEKEKDDKKDNEKSVNKEEEKNE